MRAGTRRTAAGKTFQMPINNTDTDLTDAAVIVASQRDPALFAQIFDRHWTRVHGYCVSPAAGRRRALAGAAIRGDRVRRARKERRSLSPRRR